MLRAGADADANANQAQAQNQNQNNQYYNKNYVQGTDDAYGFNKDVDWQNNWGFDASQYSLSYERCATVKQFDLDKAAQEDSTSPFISQHFAVLRLCPTKTCDRPDWYLEVEEMVKSIKLSPKIMEKSTAPMAGDVHPTTELSCLTREGTCS